MLFMRAIRKHFQESVHTRHRVKCIPRTGYSTGAVIEVNYDLGIVASKGVEGVCPREFENSPD